MSLDKSKQKINSLHYTEVCMKLAVLGFVSATLPTLHSSYKELGSWVNMVRKINAQFYYDLEQGKGIRKQTISYLINNHKKVV